MTSVSRCAGPALALLACALSATCASADDDAALQKTVEVLHASHGQTLNTLLLGERLEYAPEGDMLGWEVQGWLGYDEDKLWLKSEGAYEADINNLSDSELQVLYSRAVAPFWDLQAGARFDIGDSTDRGYGVIGLMGLAPYWFELDTALFLNDRGDLSARVEAEYDLLLTQRLILQPRFELNLGLDDDRAAGLGGGLRSLNAGLRLRYEIRREIAPYLGVEWEHAHGDTAELRRADGEADSTTRVVLGVRLWF